jgi:hypothetical protein
MIDNTRQAGVIESVYTTDDHNCYSVWVIVGFRGSSQGFGGLALQIIEDDHGKLGDPKYLEDYKQSLCDTFGVSKIEELKDKKCFALRSFEGWNEAICGLESESGKRFTHHAWRKKHFPEKVEDPLTARIKDIKMRMNSAQQSVVHCDNELRTIAMKYKEW